MTPFMTLIGIELALQADMGNPEIFNYETVHTTLHSTGWCQLLLAAVEKVANRGDNDGTMEVEKCCAINHIRWWGRGSVNPVNSSGGHGRVGINRVDYMRRQ